MQLLLLNFLVVNSSSGEDQPFFSIQKDLLCCFFVILI